MLVSKFSKSLLLGLCLVMSCQLLLAAIESSGGYSDKKITEMQSHRIIDLAIVSMKDIATARSNLKQKKYSKAVQNLAGALNSAVSIRLEEPTFRIKNRIWIAQKHLEFEETFKNISDLAPIYTDLASAEKFVPTSEARTHLDKAKAYLSKNNKEAAKSELQLASEELSYRELDLPLTRSEEAIAASENLIRRKNYALADRALRNAEEALVVTVNSVSIYTVRQSDENLAPAVPSKSKP